VRGRKANWYIAKRGGGSCLLEGVLGGEILRENGVSIVKVHRQLGYRALRGNSNERRWSARPKKGIGNYLSTIRWRGKGSTRIWNSANIN